ncbi:TonB-dependent receptor [Dysgonomonas sp. Marseille-P4677]|uniref:SusC/RagA family TonB-linked outer membrane protein n=1 Tax=Dysgonomonas sp. Marseille-P4677 TaxID=2364790 RepID=UPI00191454CB|nr:TonB-dependent receptor [Dysgonomonas sp. Marseille-P4677]MBK5722139.1 TonB-dependent receptor [Dysgonomonas sp. Marseille-P4677]
MFKRLFLFSVLLTACISLLAQHAKKISGVVTDASTGETLVGVSIFEPGTTNGTVSDIEGNYTITVTKEILTFSYVGYITQDIPVQGMETLNVKLVSNNELEEVVVVGYAAQKKSSITGAIAPVNMDDVNKRHTLSVSQALQGQISGVQITQSTGAPGDEINVLVRGEGTIGNNSPLYIIDGIPSRSITFLNPSDISSVTVLKDASAAAVYGSRASGGVIVITTKAGELGKNNVEVNYTYGLSKAVNTPKMLNTQQYLDVLERSWNNAGYSGTNPYINERNRPDIANTDWIKELFTTGQMHNIQATASGGNQSTKYLLSAGYISQDGIVVYDNDKYRRYNLRVNLNSQLTERFNVGANVQLTYAIQDKLNSKGDAPGIIRHAMLRPPVISVYKDPNDPTYNPNDPFTDLPFYKNNNRDGGWESDKYEWTSNPIALAKYTDNKRTQYTTFGNVYGEYAFFSDKSLKFKTNVGVDLNLYHNKAFNINFGDDDGGGSDVDKGMGRQNRPTNLNEERGENRTITWNNTLNYIKTLDKHSINAVAGTEYISNYDSSIGASRQRYDYTYSTFRYLDFGGTESDIWNSGTGSEWALMSMFASATYVYDNRYMLTANFRADASSRFAKKNRWGYFPSLSVGWKISEEKFMKNLSWVSDLKLRGSWGQLGNQEIDNYAFLTLLKKDGDKYVVSRYGNPDLKWETSEQANIGLDLGILRNKLYLSVDYFKKTTTDILLPISLPSFVGDVSPTIVNAGTVVNKGFESALTYRDEIGDLKYSVNANMATLSNKVTKLHPNLPIIEGQVTRTVVGQSLNSYYGFEMEGIYQNDNEIKNHLHNTTNPSVQPGDIRFRDLDNNGVIDDNDRTFLGSPIPNLTYGFTLNGEYKGFNLSMFFHGVSGVKRFNDLKKILDYDTRPFNYTTAVLDSWNGEGTSNKIPRPSFTDNGGSKNSSIFVEDASFFRLKNIELGYSFAKQLKKAKSKISDIRVYVTGENIFTVTPYSGLDPETTDLMDYGTYPQARSFLFGVNLKF